MSLITTHILDISLGRPAKDVSISLQKLNENSVWETIGKGKTDNDGRLRDLLSSGETLTESNYRLTFDVAAYFNRQNIKSFYPQVEIVFTVSDATQHYHVPLLLSPFGYSTYRGS
jgi:hydroxyisourate hydrolase